MKRLYTFINTALFCSFCAQAVMAETHSTCYKTRTGIIISKENNQIRALEPFTGLATGGTWYSNAINQYRDTLKHHVRIYSMIVPTSAGLYCPEEAKEWVRDEEPVINNMYQHLEKGRRNSRCISSTQAAHWMRIFIPAPTTIGLH